MKELYVGENSALNLPNVEHLYAHFERIYATFQQYQVHIPNFVTLYIKSI